MSKATTELDIDLAKWKTKQEEIKRDIAQLKNTARSAGGGGGLGEAIFGDLKGMLPSLGIAAAGAGVKGILSHFDEISDMAAKLGESPEVIQKVSRAASLSGTSIEALANGILKLEVNMGDLENAVPTAVLEKYGLTVETLMGMDLAEKVAALSDAYKDARDTGSGLHEFQELLGKSSKDLIPLFEEGGDAIREMYAGTATMSNAAVDEMAALNDEIDSTFGNLKVLLGQAFIAAYDGFRYIGAGFKYLFGDKDAWDDALNAVEERSLKAQAKVDERKKRREDRARNTQVAHEEQKQAKEAETATKEAEKQAKIEEDRAKKIMDLQTELERNRIDMLPPKEKIEELRKALSGITIYFDDDQLASLQKQKEQQRLQKEIDSTQTQIDRDNKDKPDTMYRVAGAASGLMNLLTGNGSSDLIAAKADNQIAELKTLNQKVEKLIANTAKPPPSPFIGGGDTFR